MNCSQYESLIALYVEGDLLGRKVRRLEDHLKQCTSCRQFAERIRGSQRLLKILREEPLEESIFQNLQDNVLARVSGSPSDALRFGIRWLSPAWRWRIPAAAGLALLMAAVIYWTLLSITPQSARHKDSLVESSSGTSQQRKASTPLAEVGSLPTQDPALPQAETNLSQGQALIGQLPVEGQARDRRQLRGQVTPRQRLRGAQPSKISDLTRPLPQAQFGSQLVATSSHGNVDQIQARDGNPIVSNVSRSLESIAQEARTNKSVMFEPIQLTPGRNSLEVTRFEPLEVQTIKIDIPESPEQVAIKLPSSDPNIVILWLVDQERGKP